MGPAQDYSGRPPRCMPYQTHPAHRYEIDCPSLGVEGMLSRELKLWECCRGVGLRNLVVDGNGEHGKVWWSYVRLDPSDSRFAQWMSMMHLLGGSYAKLHC
jgi:hypothetical protein